MLFVKANPAVGDDAALGTSRFTPLLTLNEALRRAHINPLIKEIKIQYSSTPIAPVDFGGHEHFGWLKTNEVGTRKPFPIRIPGGIKITGIPSAGGQLPRVSINEVIGGEFLLWEEFDWLGDAGLVPPALDASISDGPEFSYFLPEVGAENVTISSLQFDGTALDKGKSFLRAAAIWGINVQDLTLIDCSFVDLHDGVIFYAHGDAGGGVPAQVTATVVGGEFSGFFPVTPVGAAGDSGHAGVWLLGTGILSVQFVMGTLFTGNHDGIEIAGSSAFGRSTSASLDVDGALFEANNNGLEIVGSGVATVSVQRCRFVENRGLTPGLDGDGVISRGMSADMSVRDSDFENNEFGIIWRCGGAPAALDLGTCLLPGGNEFLPFDFAADDFYRVHLFNNCSAAAPDVLAFGNFWIPDHQLSDPVDGTYTGLVHVGPVNDPPPLGTGPGEDRNYSINDIGTVDFVAGPCPPGQ